MKNKTSNKIDIGQKDDVKISRRSFIKKTAYIAPTLFILGTLSRPTSVKAEFGKPPSGPIWE